MLTDDLRYEPPTHHYDWLIVLKPASCLVLGEVPDEDCDAISAIAKEVRAISGARRASILHRGTYAFFRDGSWHALILASGKEPRLPESRRRKYTDDIHPLVFADLLHEDLWEQAHAFAGRAIFKIGDMVQVKGSGSGVGRIKDVFPVPGGYQYQVDLHGDIKRYNEEALTLVQGDPREPAFWMSQT
ncbi:hypothetical protein ACFWDZ_31620, partial [Micromonospora aurantiaca]